MYYEGAKIFNYFADVVMGMVYVGIDTKSMVESPICISFSELTAGYVQWKCVQESCQPTNRDFYITTRDIARSRRIVDVLT
jgi:hypothetical protein